jgi:hypothetical protein
LQGVSDPDVLGMAADEGRVLVTHDHRTMPRHFAQFISQCQSSGVFIIPQRIEIAAAIAELLLIWSASDSDEWTHAHLLGGQSTAGSVIEDDTHLFHRDAGEPFDKLHCGSPILEVFKKCSNGNAHTSEYPCSADTFWVSLNMKSIQLREEHWVIADLIGKAGHICTVPIPYW